MSIHRDVESYALALKAPLCDFGVSKVTWAAWEQETPVQPLEAPLCELVPQSTLGVLE